MMNQKIRFWFTSLTNLVFFKNQNSNFFFKPMKCWHNSYYNLVAKHYQYIFRHIGWQFIPIPQSHPKEIFQSLQRKSILPISHFRFRMSTYPPQFIPTTPSSAGSRGLAPPIVYFVLTLGAGGVSHLMKVSIPSSLLISANNFPRISIMSVTLFLIASLTCLSSIPLSLRPRRC